MRGGVGSGCEREREWAARQGEAICRSAGRKRHQVWKPHVVRLRAGWRSRWLRIMTSISNVTVSTSLNR